MKKAYTYMCVRVLCVLVCMCGYVCLVMCTHVSGHNYWHQRKVCVRVYMKWSCCHTSLWCSVPVYVTLRECRCGEFRV